MSSYNNDADIEVYQDSLQPEEKLNLFSEKKYTYINDNSSNGGNFNGQIQFDLQNLSSQQNWTSLKEAYIQFPIKLTLKNTLQQVTDLANLEHAMTIKSGFHNFVDSIQIVLNNQTVQSSQIFTNIPVNYKILTEWSKEELEKYGPSLGLSMDDFKLTRDGTVIKDGIENTNITSLSPGHKGVVTTDILNNSGVAKRSYFTNSGSDAASVSSILGNNTSILHKNQTQIKVGASDPGDAFICSYILGTVRLKDISSAVSNLPLMKNVNGFIYVNYNSASCTFSKNNAEVDPVTESITLPLAGYSSVSEYGRVQPAALTGLGTVSIASGNTSFEFKSEISGVKDPAFTEITPPLTSARLYVPYYVANPVIDSKLSFTKKIYYLENFINTFDISANSSYSGTITPGIVNAKKLILYPYLTGAGDGTAGLTAFKQNPLLSPFDAVPFTTSPFAAIKDFQITHGGKQVFQSPISSDKDAFLQHISSGGNDGGLESKTTLSSLLNEDNWNKLYRYYAGDLSRKTDGEDGSSKSIQVSLTNATNAPMKVIAIVQYTRELTVNTATGEIMQR